LLRQHYQSEMRAQMIRGLQEDDNDPDYRAETAVWDVTVADGLEDAD
jgi:hypothetical protein